MAVPRTNLNDAGVESVIRDLPSDTFGRKGRSARTSKTPAAVVKTEGRYSVAGSARANVAASQDDANDGSRLHARIRQMQIVR
jgi:hypothetical protein